MYSLVSTFKKDKRTLQLLAQGLDNVYIIRAKQGHICGGLL